MMVGKAGVSSVAFKTATNAPTRSTITICNWFLQVLDPWVSFLDTHPPLRLHALV